MGRRPLRVVGRGKHGQPERDRAALQHDRGDAGGCAIEGLELGVGAENRATEVEPDPRRADVVPVEQQQSLVVDRNRRRGLRAGVVEEPELLVLRHQLAGKVDQRDAKVGLFSPRHQHVGAVGRQTVRDAGPERRGQHPEYDLRAARSEWRRSGYLPRDLHPLRRQQLYGPGLQLLRRPLLRHPALRSERRHDDQ